MTFHRFATAASIAVLVCTHGIAAQAAEIKVVAAEIMEDVLKDLGPKFEKATGHKLVVKSGLAVALSKELQAGEAFDLVVFPTGLIKNPDNQALYAQNTLVAVAKVGQGVAVRAGAPKPDISTPDKFKAALQKAQSVAFVPPGASGMHTLKVFETLGIAEEMKAKTKAQKTPNEVPVAVAKGEVELGLMLMNILTAAHGIDIIGPYPGELQQYLVFSGVVGAKAREPDAAAAFIKFLAAPDAAPVIKEKGLLPAA